MTKRKLSGCMIHHQDCTRTGSFIHCSWECNTGHLLWQKYDSFLKAKHFLPYDQAVEPLATYSREIKTYGQPNTCKEMFTVTLFLIA